MKVPRSLLVTTKVAYESDIKQIFDENPKLYSRTLNWQWQGNIIITFLLYELQKNENSPYYDFIQNLPKEIDFLSYWTPEELELLEDKDLAA